MRFVLDRRRVVRPLAIGSLVAGVVHVGLCPSHFEEATVFGLFFLVTALAQLWWAATIVGSQTRPLYLWGAAIQLVPATVWLVSRTVGLPFGPDPWEAEAIGGLDVVTTLIEVAVGLVAAGLALGAERSLRLTEPLRHFWTWLPRGGVLPDDVWKQRHRAILGLLWLHIPALVLFGAVRRRAVFELVAETALLVLIATVATRADGRRFATVTTAVGLLTCSAVLVHLSGGVIEMHFHYFVMVGVITLYQDWWPFLIAIGYVVLQHGLAGVIDPGAVYNHPEAVEHPWQWAGIHGLFVLGMSSAGIASWRLNESFLGRVRDEVFERRQAEADLRDALSLLTATLDATADGILVVDTDGKITSFNQRFVEMWGIPDEILETRDDEQAIGFVLSQLRDPKIFVGKVRELYAHPDAESQDSLEFTDGRIYERYSTPQRVGGKTVGRVWSFHDVTERARLQDELAHQAFHDSLTGLANQALFRDRVDHALARSSRGPARVAALFVDLDDFKTVNDSLGHNVGDEILVQVAARLRSSVRTTDTVARLGGDEFVVLVEDVEDDAAVLSTAERIVQTIRQPFHAEDRAVHIHTSIGIAFATDGATSDMLLRNADLAMYTAKRQGKDRFAVYESEMHAAALARLELEGDLRRALIRGEFLLHYQPVVDMTNGGVVGVEALVRWDHPERGLLSPGAFIGLAEETGLIVELGRQVLSQACRQAAAWVQDDSAFYVTVNISARQLETSIVDDVRRCLDESGLPATSLVLEMTETGMMEDTAVAIAAFETLKDLGVRIAVDDFGTGYSSLSYLQRFPVDILKIDRSFVSTIDTQLGDKSLVRTIMSLARTLNLTAVAEGVETAGQADALLKLGCVFAQGFHYWRPMEAAAIPDVLARVTPAGAGSGR